MTRVRERISRPIQVIGESTKQRVVSELERMYAHPCRRGLFCEELGSVCQEGYCDNCIIHEAN